MESELKDLNSKPPNGNGNSVRDDRPLLKPEPPVSADSIADMEKKFAAYVRRDVYGTMGRGELPTKEKLLLGFALVTLLPIRVVLAVTILLFYYLICRVCTLFSAPTGEEEQEDYAHMSGWRRTIIVSCGRALSRLMLFIFGFYWIPESNSASQVSLKLLCLFHFLTFLLFTLFWDSMCIHKLKFCLPLYLYVSTKKSKSEGVISTLIVSGEILPDIFFLFVFRTKSYCMSFSLG